MPTRKTMTPDEARNLESEITAEHNPDGVQGGDYDAVMSLQRVGAFVRSLDGELLYYRNADGRLYTLKAEPRTDFGRYLRWIFPCSTQAWREEAVEMLICDLGEAAPVLKVTVTDARGARRTRPAHFAKRKKYSPNDRPGKIRRG